MAIVFDGQKNGEEPEALASQILDRADRDVTFMMHLVGESRNLLVRHFVKFIETTLAERGINYDTHALLRPFVEAHARELTDFVLHGIGLKHQFGLQAFERMGGDPGRLLRVDLWDSLHAHISDAQRHFVFDVDGLARVLIQIENEP